MGSMRAIIDYGNFPRYVGHQREVPFYFPGKLNETKNVIGSIPQVNHTFGYIEVTRTLPPLHLIYSLQMLQFSKLATCCVRHTESRWARGNRGHAEDRDERLERPMLHL